MVAQMLTTYGQEATEDRIRGYLEVTSDIPLRSFPSAIKGAMRSASGSWPPGPGEILAAWDWNSRRPLPGLPTPPDPTTAIGPGERVTAARLAIEARANHVENAVGDPTVKKILDAARCIRRVGKVVPRGFEGRSLSYVAAALALDLPWPISAEHRAQMDRFADLFEAEGGDIAWWREESARPTVTRDFSEESSS